MSLNPVTFRGQGLDGKERNLTIGRTHIGIKQFRSTVLDGPHRLDPGDKLVKLCPIILWDEPDEPIATIMLDEDELITIIKEVILGHPAKQGTKSLQGPSQRGSKVNNRFAMRRIIDKVTCRLCDESKTKDVQEALKDSLVIDLEKFVGGLTLLFPKGELE